MCECAARSCYACTQLSRSSPSSPRKQNLLGKTTEVHAKVRGSTGRLQTRQHAERCRLEQCYCARSTLIGGAALSRASRAAARFDRGCGARSWRPTAEREVYAMLVDMAKGVASKTFFRNSRRLVRSGKRLATRSRQGFHFHCLNGFRLHQTAMYLERQTQFGDIPWPREGSAGVFLDSAQAVTHGVRVAMKDLSRTAHRCIVVLPDPKRFEQQLPVVVGKVGKTSQCSADRFDHRLRRGRTDDQGKTGVRPRRYGSSRSRPSRRLLRRRPGV